MNNARIIESLLKGISSVILSWVGQETNQFSGNLHDIGDNFLVVFHIFENSGSSREVFVDFDLVTTVA